MFKPSKWDGRRELDNPLIKHYNNMLVEVSQLTLPL